MRTPNEPAWSQTQLASDPHAAADKPERVRSMFAAIAPAYDLNNRLHSMWRDQAWRRFAVRKSGLKPGETVIDVACGTGDLSLAFARAGAGRVIGIDFTLEMLHVARERKADPRITYVQGDAQRLPLADACADVVSIAFGIRNVQDVDRALSEFRRVLRAGGRLVVLEFCEPRNPLVRWFNNFYCRQIMPRTATWISGDRSGAYKYLPRSVETFLSPEQLRGKIESAGFADTRFNPLTLGICGCTVAIAK
ncbi:MAG: bifunctional demethylmenaquinone methyltransferase/2-methoxy-6-polyprenyl-1,4-benzoquinol methylase UbiE [Phycisphaeraceae bacterium]|nr:bifunctional demethylmenaquinone methyltransferase/2-methoxy-6-polyprenyl-1,4-benzoquinol methylase UbiE [Phycisphaeraceae bacterium]